MIRALLAAAVLVAIVAAMTAMLPVPAAIRRALTAVEIDPARVQFASARLGWNGVVLGDVAIETHPGSRLALSSVRLRPSLRGLLWRADGLPATVAAELCGGFVDGRAEPAAAGRRVSGVWSDVDLARCAPGLGVPGELTGFVQGRADLTLGGGQPTHGTGIVRLRDVRWSVPGIPRHIPTRADDAEMQWDVAADVLTIRRFTLRNDGLTATGVGTVRVVTPFDDSALALELTIAPARGMPQAHRDFLASLPGGPPDRHGARRFTIGGTVGAPILGRPS